MRGRFRRAAGAVLLPGCGEGFGGGGRFRSCVPPSGQRAERDVPVLRAFRVCGRAGPRARIAAARFARVIARARRRTHLARPFPPGSFSRPQPSLSAETPKGGPRGAASLLSFYHTSPQVKPTRKQKMKTPGIVHGLPMEPRPGAVRSEGGRARSRDRRAPAGRREGPTARRAARSPCRTPDRPPSRARPCRGRRPRFPRRPGCREEASARTMRRARRRRRRRRWRARR